jgi:hypothetical protein
VVSVSQVSPPNPVHASPQWSLSPRLPHQTLYTPLTSRIRATCPSRILLIFITRKILGEEYRTLIYSLRSFLHSPGTSSLVGRNILLHTIFSYSLKLVLQSLSPPKFHAHTKQKAKFYLWIS